MLTHAEISTALSHWHRKHFGVPWDEGDMVSLNKEQMVEVVASILPATKENGYPGLSNTTGVPATKTRGKSR